MLQRLNRQDWLLASIMLFGFAVAVIHMASDNILTGVLVIGALLLGGVVRLTIGAETDALHNGMAASTDKTPSRSLSRRGRWIKDGEARSPIWLRSGIIAGFTATIIMSIALVAGYLIAGIFADQDANMVSGWFYGLTHNSLTEDTFDIPIGAYGLNLLAGVMWALIYAYAFEGRFNRPGWQRGTLFSILPWLLSLLVFFPVVGAGILGADLGAGPLPVVGNLVLHLIYGAALGWVYAAQTSVDVEANATDETRLQAGWIDQGIALGLAGGLTIGMILGAFAGLIVDPAGITTAELALGGAAIGVLGGLIVGPLAGLETGSSHSAPHIS